MGASSWLYFTPYDPSPAVALRHLRERVLTSGDYRKPASVQERLSQLGPLPLPSELHRQTAEKLRGSPGALESLEAREMIAHLERLAEEASAREPEYLRLMEALRNGTLDSLPEVQERNALVRELLGPVPEVVQRGPRKRRSDAGVLALVLLQAGLSGTHSILDITRVGKRPAHATAFPLQSRVLLDTFGTTEPSRAQVEASEREFVEVLHWQAVYFAVFEQGAPTEWAFAGTSGD